MRAKELETSGDVITRSSAGTVPVRIVIAGAAISEVTVFKRKKSCSGCQPSS